MRLQELKPSGGVLYSVQPTLSEASGQVGEAPAAVSWEWLPGAPCVGAHDAWAVHGENSSCGRMGTASFWRVAGTFGACGTSYLLGKQKAMLVRALLG